MIKMHVQKDTVHELQITANSKEAVWDFSSAIAAVYMMFAQSDKRQAEKFKALMQASMSDLSPIWNLAHLNRGEGTFMIMDIPGNDSDHKNSSEN